MINIKTEKEIEVMREGGKILANILDKLLKASRAGITTNDLEKLGCELILSYGAKPSFLGHENYPAALCTSLNNEIVHALPSDRKLKQGDLLTIDTGIFYKGFHTDMASTIIIPGGKKNEIKEKLVSVTKKALEIGIFEAKPGNTMGDMGYAIQEYVESQGFNVVRELVGHGIGRELHEDPQVPNYGKRGLGEKLRPGMVIAIEPMVVIGKWAVKESADGFGFETKDGGLAAHFEHTIVVTKGEPLTITEF